jgi:hypothetical protein
LIDESSKVIAMAACLPSGHFMISVAGSCPDAATTVSSTSRPVRRCFMTTEEQRSRTRESSSVSPDRAISCRQMTLAQ